MNLTEAYEMVLADVRGRMQEVNPTDNLKDLSQEEVDLIGALGDIEIFLALRQAQLPSAEYAEQEADWLRWEFAGGR